MPTEGRPPLFESEDQLTKTIDGYYEYIKGEFEWVASSDQDGNPFDEKVWTRGSENPSVTGLALFLGFESRQSIYDYEKNGKFSYIIKRAKLRVEAAYEQALLSRNSTGAIFALKNFGWSDKSEVVNTNLNTDIKVTEEEAARIKKSFDKEL